MQAVRWYLRYPRSYRDLEEMFRERGFEVEHSTINRWVLACVPVNEKRLRQFRRPYCGSLRINETYVKIRGKWRPSGDNFDLGKHSRQAPKSG